MEKKIIILLIALVCIFYTKVYGISPAVCYISSYSDMIIEYFKRTNLHIRIEPENLSEHDTKKLYKLLRSYINQIYWKNPPPNDKILKIIVTYDEITKEFNFESYFSEKCSNYGVLYV